MMITVLTKVEARCDQQEKVVEDMARFSRKALDEIYRLSSVQQPMIASSSSQSAEEEMSESDRELYFHNGTNLLKVPGSNAAEKAYEIVKILWSEQERKVLCIDPKRELTKDRVASEELRTRGTSWSFGRYWRSFSLNTTTRSIREFWSLSTNAWGRSEIESRGRSEIDGNLCLNYCF